MSCPTWPPAWPGGRPPAWSRCCIALGLASAFSGRIISPLRQLSEDTSALAAGKLTHRTEVNTQDEVGALANTFNAMAAALEERHRELDLAREAASAEATERARLEQMERQAKETLAAVIDASPVAIVCSDLDRQIVLWSRAAEQIFGYTAEEMVGGRTKLVPPESEAESRALFERCLTGEALRDVEVKRKRKDGSIVDIRLAATPMYNPDGKAWGVAWAYDDITDRKKAERQLNQIAHHDQLTGLPNRVSLKNELTSLLDARRRPLAFRRAVRPRRLQGRERHRRPFDRRRVVGGGGEAPESCRRRQPAGSTGSAATSSSSSSPDAAIPSASPSSSS